MAVSKNHQSKMNSKRDFYSRKWLVSFSLKKGVFFTIDSLIGAGIILTVIIFTSSIYVNEAPSSHLNYLSQDLIGALSSLTVKEANNEYLNILIGDGTIKNTNNTLLEQIGEFWAAGQVVFANKTAANVTKSLVSNITGMGIWIDNEPIYSNGLPLKKSLVSSKMPVSGIKKGETSLPYTRANPPTLWGPAIAEVRVWQ